MANTPKPADMASGSEEREETYDEWFHRQVDRAVAQADNPNTKWVPHSVVMQDWEEQQKEILAMIENK